MVLIKVESVEKTFYQFIICIAAVILYNINFFRVRRYFLLYIFFAVRVFAFYFILYITTAGLCCWVGCYLFLYR